MVSRRDFLKYSGTCALGLSLPGEALARVVRVDNPLESYPGRAWEDFYRREFTATRGDSLGYAFHCSNCQGNCAWRLHAKDGVLAREEQLAEYPQVSLDIPDPNPRGCNKGAIHSQAMYEKDRLRYPLKRVGRRGGGKWRRISWRQAIAEIGEKMVDTLAEHGPGGLMVYTGTGLLSQGRRSSSLRLGSLLGAVRMYPSSAVGDMFTGASLAYGIPNVGTSLDAWFEMDLIVLWGVNPNVTRIPDAHYLWEGKYNGAKIVTIAPDYNQTSIHADQWIPLNPGSDSFLAMSLVHALFKEKLYKEDFIRVQTDLPFLVRLDDGKLLRESDLKDGGGDEVFYFWDRKTERPAAAPGTRGSKRDTLRPGKIDPALKGRFTVKDLDGKPIRVTTVFELARAEAAKFPPEKTRERTGVHPSVVYGLAREYARARDAGITIGFSIHKYAWGILTCWAQALFCALTGHDVVDTEHQWSLGGIGPLSAPKPARFESGFLSEWMAGRMWETFRMHYGDEQEFRGRMGLGTEELVRLAEKSRDEKWLAYFGEPKVRILFADNMFRRNKSSEHYKKTVLDATELYVNVNFRMDSSAELADYVLPSQSHYEGWDIRGEVGYHRFVNLNVPPPGLKPVGEAKSEWEICRLLAARIEEAAKARGLAKLNDPVFTVTREDKKEPVTRDLDTLHDDFTMNGKLNTDKDVVKWLIANVPAFQPWKFEDAAERGFLILNSNAGLTSPLYANRPYRSFEEQFYLKRPYPTLSGRQQFYIDHEVFQQLGAAVPTAREPLHPAKFPLKFYSPHTRWGIHSTWRSNKHMLRQQRGVPHVYLNPADAARRGIRDGGRIRVFNDIGAFHAMAKLHPGTRPGSIMMEHGWEPHQFRGRKGLNGPVAGLLSPLELAGGWGHLKFGATWDGNQLAYESTVDVEKA
ncbi:MAG: dimethylsulfide dehydrogenase [Rhodospirillaceae bacterium]|jgi:dimethylsulfide dehydrogenase subunit alpha/complex iron-sulfur molybdoenzyme family reductase subunit alpha|nr:dimethylsulfide dehydrogenase [Rhodospirillaceae bacterium]|tara:strand:+ start:834 stop:3584 length:2751 start_codon:yes stop_codon:yes gene_type:complete